MMRSTKRLTLGALFLALGLVLPFLTMQIPEIGSMLLPMHIPVLICGFVCGWKYGLFVGMVVPLMRSLIWGMPPILSAIPMMFELGVYGAIAGLLYFVLKNRKCAVYVSLLGSMIAGRIVWGIVSFLFQRILGNSFTWEMFAAGAVINAIPGIILQLVFIPPIIIVLQKSRFLDK